MALIMVPVHVKVQDLWPDAPATGRVVVRIPQPLRDAAGVTIYPPCTFDPVELVDGEATIPVPATDQPDVVSAGHVYVGVTITDEQGAPVWSETRRIAVPHEAAVVEYATASTVVAGPPDPSYATSAALAAHEAATAGVHGIADTVDLVLTGDPRLSDARTPLPHAASHAAGGADAITLSQAQVAGLDTALAAKADLVGGVVPTAQIPAIAITTYLGEAASEAEMLALAGELGDWTIRTDTATTWVITGPDPSQLSSWTALAYPAAVVVSVNGQAGVVVLAAADVGALPIGGGTLTGPVTIQTGGPLGPLYRLRQGAANDFETFERLYLSVWDGPGFTGEQHFKAVYEPNDHTQLVGVCSYRPAPDGPERHTINPVTGVAHLGSKNGLAHIQVCGFTGSAGAPTTDAWDVGDLVLATDGWYLCTVAGTPGTWAPL